MWAVSLALTVVCVQCVLSQYLTPSPRVWHFNKYPDPWWFPEECNRVNKSAICDPNAIITMKEADKIDDLIESVALDTRCPCYDCVSNQRGYIIRVALMEQMEHQASRAEEIMDKLQNTRRFAYFLTKRWKLTGNCNETLLIVYSQRDNVLYTMPGSQAGKLLTDKLIVEISLEVLPYFEDRETVATGLMKMIKLYRKVFRNTYTGPGGSRPEDKSPRDDGAAAGIMTWSPVLILVSMVTLSLP